MPVCMPASSWCSTVMEHVAGMWKAGESSLVSAAFQWVGDSPVLVAEPLLGLKKCWRLINGQTLKGKLGIPQDSVKMCCWDCLWLWPPLPSTGVEGVLDIPAVVALRSHRRLE